jgi:two-component system response regulator FixJ
MSATHIAEAVDDPDRSTEKRILYVVDDNAEVRKSLHFALDSSGIMVWPFATPTDFLDSLAGLIPAPILLDVRMPDIDGVQLLQIVRERSIEWPVIMMTAHGDIPVAVASMKLGALDFLEKPFAIERLEEMLDAAFAKVTEVVVTTDQRSRAMRTFAALSGREKQVALGLASGKTNKDIAKHLDISVRTVEIHRASALRKMDVKSTADAVRLLIAAGAA